VFVVEVYVFVQAPNSPDEISSFWTGNMKDRHLFSMLCYENFASLHHLPFILSGTLYPENYVLECQGSTYRMQNSVAEFVGDYSKAVVHKFTYLKQFQPALCDQTPARSKQRSNFYDMTFYEKQSSNNKCYKQNPIELCPESLHLQ